MTVPLWRIAVEAPGYKANDLSGAGAKISGGRWNSIGTPLIYSATNIALATIETVLHLRNGGAAIQSLSGANRRSRRRLGRASCARPLARRMGCSPVRHDKPDGRGCLGGIGQFGVVACAVGKRA